MKFSSVPAYSIGIKYPSEAITSDKFNPPPGAYEVTKDIANNSSFTIGVADRGLTSADYYKSRLGPGCYNYQSFLDLSLKQRPGKRSKPAKDKGDKSKIETPGPSSYNPKPITTSLSASFGNKSFSLTTMEADPLGPGKYNPNLSSIKSSLSCSFGKAPKLQLKPSAVPGPGSYSLKSLTSAIKFGMGQAPRGKAVISDVPGPGEYNIPGIAEQLKSKAGISMMPRRSLSIAVSDTPGPGSYDAKEQTSKLVFTLGKGKRSEMAIATKTPGPGAYSPKRSQTLKGTIGKGTRPPMIKSNDNPGPGTYEIKSLVDEGVKYSLGGRRTELKNGNDKPGPGQYSPEIAITRPDRIHVVIGTGKRSGETLEVKPLPGPGEYNPSFKAPTVQWTFAKDARVNVDMDDTPGPGYYQTPASIPDVPKYLINIKKF